jgi:hypothetical protein
VVVKLAGAAAEIDVDERFNTQEWWGSAWTPDRQEAIGAAIEAKGTKDLHTINEYVNDCFAPACEHEFRRGARASAGNGRHSPDASHERESLHNHFTIGLDAVGRSL